MAIYNRPKTTYDQISAENWFPPIHFSEQVTFPANTDGLLVVTDDPTGALDSLPANIADPIRSCKVIDQQSSKPGQAVLIPAPGLPGNRLIWIQAGPLNHFTDDVRRYAEAGNLLASRAIMAGIRQPALVSFLNNTAFVYSQESLLHGFLSALWQPLEAREHKPDSPFKYLTVLSADQALQHRLAQVIAIEKGRFVARDITGPEPERMSPEEMAVLCQVVFKGTSVGVSIESDPVAIDREYPLVGAVSRASIAVERHHPRIIRLEYTPPGTVHQTVYLIGKGLTYDTGGADLKVDGHMAGMSRDKGGAGAVAGFFKVLAEQKPANLKVIGYLGAVRNSIGPDAFVTDEIITSRAGVRVRIGNTDAEGRLVLADLLARAAEESISAINPVLMTIATLTGHSYRAYGSYPLLIENGVSLKSRFGSQLQDISEQVGDPFERSRLRREDYEFVAARSGAEDIVSCNSAPSSATPRGHQFPAAFLDITSGLDKHGIGSQSPLPFIHVDIGGNGAEGGDWQFGKPTGSPVLALSKWLVG